MRIATALQRTLPFHHPGHQNGGEIAENTLEWFSCAARFDDSRIIAPTQISHGIWRLLGRNRMVVTLADLARATQLSVSTVSRAWSDPSKVNESTRRRVLESAAELGYSRDSSQKTGRAGPGGSVGLIVPDIANPFFPPIIKAIQERARYRGKTVLLADTDEQYG